MPQDLNKLMAVIQKDSKDLETRIKDILAKYEELHRAGNRQYVEEREASSSMVGLEDFYMLVQTIRRNKDVMGSLLRGIGNLRNLSKYKFVEEEVTEKRPSGQRRRRNQTQVPVLPPEMTSEPPENPAETSSDNGESLE